MNKTIGEESGESCSMCGRANTWHPDCPICEYIIDLEVMLEKALKIVESNKPEDPWDLQTQIYQWSKSVSKLLKDQ